MEYKKYESWYRKWPSVLNNCRPEQSPYPEGGNTLFRIEELRNMIKIVEFLPFPEGNGFALVSSGAEHGSACQRFMKSFPKHGFKLFMTELSSQTVQRIQETAPGIPACRNPIYTGGAGGEVCAAIIEILLSCEEAGILICQDCFSLPGINASRIRSLAKKIRISRKPVIFFGSSARPDLDALPENLVTYPDISNALLAAQFLVEFRNNLEIKMLETAWGSKPGN
jgi:acyl-CoA synthetase (NDP forming)